jgi:S-adenosylmethionine:diacylglycerol 3-amino-3-carboxypropyl transferase
LDEKALMHQKGNNLPDFFYSKFRNFFTATSAKHNFFLQLYLLGEVLYKEAFPLYLQPGGIQNIIKRSPQLNFQVNSIFDLVEESEELKFENYALSNISDWCEEETMNRLLSNIFKKSKDSVDIVIRYIHKNPINDFTDHIGFERDPLFANAMISIDRFPFYSLLKINSRKSGDG